MNTVVELPSRGMIYDKNLNIPSEVVIRPFTTKDEKSLYGSGGIKGLNSLISNCIVEPKELDIDNLTSFDKTAILIKLRSITLGSEYTFKVKCRSCGETQDVKVDLDELPVDYLDETELPITVELPRCKDTLEIKFLSEKVREKITKEAQRACKKSKENVDDELYIIGLMNRIVTINGETLDVFSLRDYVENLTGYDSAFLRKKLSDVKVGVDMVVDVECKCGEESEALVSPGYEFFQPTFQ